VDETGIAVEIDIVTFNEETGDILFGEIKYTTRKVGVKTLLA